MALFGAKPLLELVLIYHQIDFQEQISIKFNSKYNKPIALVPQCTSTISHNEPLCDRNGHISVAKWCIVEYLSDALWDLWDGHIQENTFQNFNGKVSAIFSRPQCFITGILHIYIYIYWCSLCGMSVSDWKPIGQSPFTVFLWWPTAKILKQPKFNHQSFMDRSQLFYYACRAVCKLVWLIEAEWRIYALVNLPSLVQTKSAPGHYQNQCWNFVKNKLQSDLNRNSYILIQGNAFENVVWEMSAILSQPQGVNQLETKENIFCYRNIQYWSKPSHWEFYFHWLKSLCLSLYFWLSCPHWL